MLISDWSSDVCSSDLLARPLRGRHALVVSDDNVAPLYLQRTVDALRAARPDIHVASHPMPAGEREKTLARFGDAIDSLAAPGDRQSVVSGKGVSVRVDLGGSGILKKKHVERTVN